MSLLRLLGKLDLDELAADFMSRLKIQPFDLYFIVLQEPGAGDYEILGMAYSRESAQELKVESQRKHRAGTVKALCLDIAKLLKVIEQFQAAYEV